MTFLNLIESIIGNQTFVLVTILASFLLKLLIIIFTFNQQVNTRIAQRLRFFLLAILGVNIFSDIVWIQTLLQNMSILDIDPRIYKFTGRFAWALIGIQYQGLALFLEGLVTRQYKLSIRQQLCSVISTFLVLASMGATFVYFNHPGTILLIATINRIAIGYYTFFLLPCSLFIVLRKLHMDSLPHILTKQLYIIAYGLIIPHLISELIQYFPFYFSLHLITNQTAASFSALLLSIGLLYYSRKIMGLRFLNFRDHVHAPPKADFITNFKAILEELGQVASTYELKFIVQNFLKKALNIPLQKTKLYLRPVAVPYQPAGNHYNTHATAEKFISLGESATKELMKKKQVLIYDEISFSHFYDQTTQHENLLHFLEAIQADVFLPIYYKNRLIAYIIVERHARKKKLYNSADRDEMLMFAGYLSNTINVLHNQSIESLMKKIIQLTQENRQLVEEKKELKQNFSKEKEEVEKNFIQGEEVLRKELHFRHQEMNQYRECFQSFLYKNSQPIGTIFYKNNRFTFGNQEAKDLISVNINTHVGHPLVKKIRQVVDQVADFRSPKTTLIKNEQGETLSLAVIPHLEPGGVIIIVSYAAIPDLVKQKINFLKDPNRWDYLLYLETTGSGRLINQLIPGNGKTLLDFKIELLKTALSKKATLLDIAEKDLAATVELIHQTSLREELYTLNLQGTPDTVAMATKLFGINPLFGAKQDEPPLLELLDGRGTLFIKDIHLLDLDCQEYLAEFIRYGIYRIYKSEERKRSNVRIICSSNQDIPRLLKENKFSPTLFAELKHATFSMPTLSSLPKEELHSLSDGFSQQAVANNTFNNLLALTDKDKNKLAKTQPASLYELKNRVKQLVIQKAEKSNIQQETTIDPAYETNDPMLLHAARLGKHALKDKKTMTLLWQKFNKNQNKIAEFLGVNRSSVHRRCKLYHLS